MPREGHVDVDGTRVRYVEAGEGPALVHLGDGSAAPAHDLLGRRFRVIALEAPGAGPASQAAIGRTLTSLGVASFDLVATSEASAAALRLALHEPERVRALVLESPTAILRDTELESRLSDVAAPTLVLFGTDDRPDAQQTGRVYAARLPSGHLVFVYGAAHQISRERPEAFAEVVLDFLERHEAFVINRTPTVIHP
jgi:pimeloyl-ACP methyl ester carboxylesterase